MVKTDDGLVLGGLTGKVIGAAMEVHKNLGTGFLESVYEEALAYEFDLQKIDYERQKPISAFYKEKAVKQFICDFCVSGQVIVETKAIKSLTDVDKLQVLNYLKASSLEVGLLINFGGKSLEFKRFINNFNP